MIHLQQRWVENISQRWVLIYVIDLSLEKNSLIIDVGSNSGVLLAAFKSKEMKVLGIEPSSKLANVAIEKGIDSIMEFFSENFGKTNS